MSDITTKELMEILRNLKEVAYGWNIGGEVLGMACSEFKQVMMDAADRLEQLEKALAEVIDISERYQAMLLSVAAERDAAVAERDELRTTDGVCVLCKHRTRHVDEEPCNECLNNDPQRQHYEYRGPRPEGSAE